MLTSTTTNTTKYGCIEKLIMPKVMIIVFTLDIKCTWSHPTYTDITYHHHGLCVDVNKKNIKSLCISSLPVPHSC